MTKKKLILLLFFCLSCSKNEQPPLNDLEKISFHRGYTIWKDYLEFAKMPYDIEQVINGMRAADKGEKLGINEEELALLVRRFQEELLAKTMEENLVEAEKFLQTISKTSVELIPSKLYYICSCPGSGQALSRSDTPQVRYKVRILQDGIEKEIYSAGDLPLQISLQDTISGFVEGVVGMLEGEKRVIYIHPDLTSGKYPFLPNKLLIIEVELVRI